jgi:hypothetical protein
MENNMKLRLKSKEFLKKHGDSSPDVVPEMLVYAGKMVTVKIDCRDFDSDYYVSIEEDKGEWSWAPWMFEKFPKKFRAPKLLTLKEGEVSSDGDSHFQANVAQDGSVEIGCTTVLFSAVERLYKAAKRARRFK